MPLALAEPVPEAEAEADAKAWGYGRIGKSIAHHPYGPGFGHGFHGFPAHTAPLIHHPKPVPVVKCHTVYDTTYTTKCKNVPERICKAVPITKYRHEHKTECHAVPEKVCHPVTRTVPDKVCHTHPEKVCKPTFKTVYDTTYEEQCKDIEHKVSMLYFEYVHTLSINRFKPMSDSKYSNDKF